ncbi:MAG: hypothetical protein AB2417_02770 [Clostridiaceae bacterium]
MKDQIIGYLTAMINSYENRTAKIINNVPVTGMQKAISETRREHMKGFIEDLNDMLDFVEDIREEDEDPIIVNIYRNNDEIKKSRKYIKELEEGCELNNEVILKQFKRIQSLENENKQLQEKIKDSTYEIGGK